MKFWGKRRFLTKSVVQISLMAFVGVAIATFAGGYLTDHFMRKEATRSEGTRLAQLAENYFREKFSAGAWKDPGGAEAFSIYENLAGTHLFGKHEALRHFAVWGPDGRLIWSSNPDVRPSPEFMKSLEKARRGEAQFFVEPLQHGHENEPAHVGSLLGFITPLWLEGEMGMDRPDVVLELHTEPQFFFKGMNVLRKRVWGTTMGVGVVIFFMAFGGIVRIGFLHEIAKKQASRMENIGSMARAVGSTLDPAEIFRIIVEEVRKAVPCDRCAITSLEQEKKRVIKRHYISGVKLPPLSNRERSERREWISRNVYGMKSPIVLRDINDENGILLRLFQGAGLKCLLFIPILQDGLCVSHLSLSSFHADAFPEEDIELLITIADQISPALRNSTLHKISYERTARLESMQRLNWQIAENLNLQKVLNSIVSAVVEFLHIDFVNIYFVDKNEENLISHCWGGSVPGPPPREGGKNSFPVNNTLGGKVYRTGEAAIIPDIQEVENWVEMEWVRKVGLHSFISQPLRHGGKNIGIINCMSREKDFFSQEDLEFLSGLASQAAIAIANARLHEEDTRRATRLETLQRLTRKMNENLALPELLAAITAGSAELLDATRIAAISVDKKNNIPEIFYKHGLSNKYVKNLLSHYKETTIPEAMKMMEPVAIENVFSSPSLLPNKLAMDEGIGALLSVPLLYKGSSFGVLALYWDDPRVFSPVDIGLAKAFGDQVANAVQNARLHEEAQRSRDFFQSIMDDNADAMMVSDEEQKILRWNSAAEKLYGYTEVEMLGRSVEILIPEDCLDDLNVGKGVRTYGNEVAFDTCRVRKDGKRVPVSISISPVKDERGHVIACCGIHKDLTFWLQQEEELREAKDEAEAATQAKSEFLANMSHEIRTPMNGVIGMTSLLLETDLTAQQRSYAEMVQSSGEGLLTVINDILDFSKIEAGKLTIDPVPIDLRVVVDEVISLFSFRVNEKNLNLLFYFSPEAPSHVIGDPGRIRQILNNLMGNAIKFTETGHILIRVEPETAAGGGGNVRFSVEDTGIGIPENKISKMFDQFSQADASTTRKYGGSGLGLAISKHLSEVMGGGMGAASREGEGSTFWFSLDLPIDQNKNTLPSFPEQLEGVRALIVDDLWERQNILSKQIKSWGMRPDFRASAADSLIAIRDANESGEPYEIVIMECGLPDMSGGDLARSIKSESAFQPVPLVVIAPSFDRLQEKSIVDAGFSAYLIRPLRQVQLMEMLISVQEARQAGRLEEPIPGFSLSGFGDANGSRGEENNRPIEARVLVAEDNPVNQLVAKNTLESFGCRVDIVPNGKEALEMHGVLPYDLIIMDCQMPVMDGYESTRRIRAAEKENGGHIPIIAMTAHAMGDAREECMRAGMDDYISKPIKKELLRDTIIRWVSGQESQLSAQNSGVVDSLDEGGGENGAGSLDLEILGQLKSIQRSGAPDIVAELLSVFARDVPDRFLSIRGSLTDNDSDALEKAAHRLKGSSSQLGLVRVASLSASLEKKGREGNLDGAEALMDDLEKEYQHVETLIASKPWESL